MVHCCMLALSSKPKIWWFHVVVLWSMAKNARKFVKHVPGYTASHGACKKTTNLRAKFYRKTALNGEIPVNKYRNNINHMS